jgi:mannosyltransferase OCH1-like enzyme
MKIIVQGLWIGDRLSSLEKLSIQSFLTQGHEYHLYVYQEVAGVPAGTLMMNAADVLPSSAMFRHEKTGSLAVFADVFRYQLLFEKGGWWADLDVVALKHFEFSPEYVFATERDTQGREFITNGIIKVPRQAQIMQHALDICKSINPATSIWGATGPILLHRLVFRSELSKYARSAETFCPVDPFRWIELVLPGNDERITEETVAVHMWNEMWRRAHLDKDCTYAPTSLYERLKRLMHLEQP